jgi:hypothetical protein
MTKRVPVSGKLSRFMGLTDDMTSRAKANKFIVQYIEDNDLNVVTEWEDGSQRFIIAPDEALSDLLDYEDYKERVLRGEQKRIRKDYTTGEKIQVIETNPQLTYSAMQFLLLPHFNVLNFDLDGAIYNRNIIE